MLCLRPAWCTCVQGRLEAASGASLEVVVADITKPDSLKPDLFIGVRAVVCCTAVNVSPKEGDTPNRDKYKQVGPLPLSLDAHVVIKEAHTSTHVSVSSCVSRKCHS